MIFNWYRMADGKSMLTPRQDKKSGVSALSCSVPNLCESSLTISDTSLATERDQDESQRGGSMHRKQHRQAMIAGALLLAGLLSSPTGGLAQLGGLSPTTPSPSATTVAGQATTVQATVLGVLGTATTTTLCASGTLAGTNDARDASQLTATIPSLLGAETLQADTIGWPDEVDSEASLSGLKLSVAGISISAGVIRASAVAIAGAAGSRSSEIDSLAINEVPVAVTGAPNQTIPIPGGQLVINEQTISSAGSAVVNALHVTVNGIEDVVIASATAGIS
jgi:hypothetical protein